jgi:single-strand DNA-binding protein
VRGLGRLVRTEDDPGMDNETTNVVRLAGRVSGAPVERQLPSGDRLVSFRVVVPRGTAARRRTRQSVDTVECSAWTARMRRAAARLVDGDAVVVAGELRRSFRRSGAGVTSWVTVDVDQIA